MWRHPRFTRFDRRPLPVIAQHLVSNAHRYYPEFPAGEVRVTLCGVKLRSNTVLLRFDLAAGAARRAVVAKIHTGRYFSRGLPFPHWPRLAPCPDPADAARSEYEALSAVHEHFERLEDPALGAVRALDFLPDVRALVLEDARSKTLQQALLSSSHRFGARPARELIEEACHNAGRWLRRFQQVQNGAHHASYRSQRVDLVDSIREIAYFLSAHRQAPRFVASIASEAEGLARGVLPEDPPLGLNHGDYWPGNILVGPGNRVTAIDTHGWWRTPVYEDVGYFLASVKASPPQIFTLGHFWPPETIEALERSFLAGYFGDDPVTRDPIRLYEILALLNRWGVASHAAAVAGGASRAVKVCKLFLRRRYFMHLLTRLVGEIGRPGRDVEGAA